MYKAVFFGLFLFVLVGCNQLSDPVFEQLMLNEYPSLYDAIQTREAEQILPFTQSSNPDVRTQAWNGMIHTPVNDVDAFTDRVIEDNSVAAWRALSLKELEPDQLRKIEGYWEEGSIQKAGISTVLGERGDSLSMIFLYEKMEQGIDSTAEFEFALALGRLTGRFKLNDDQEFKLVYQLLQKDDELARRYLYGYYRNRKSFGALDINVVLSKRFDRSDFDLNQYILRIMGTNQLQTLGISKMMISTPQFQIEVARMMGNTAWRPDWLLRSQFLLRSSNPIVQREVLKALGNTQEGIDAMGTFLEDNLRDELEDAVWMKWSYLILKNNPEKYKEIKKQAESRARNNPHVLPQLWDMRIEQEKTDHIIQQIEQGLRSDNPLTRFFAAEAIPVLWEEKNVEQEELISQLKPLMLNALKLDDRSVAYSLANAFQTMKVLGAEDYSSVEGALQSFKLPDDVEVYQAFSSVFYDQFRAKAKPFIDSLARYKNNALNTTFSNDGWDVAGATLSSSSFRVPDWERLSKMGRSPKWLLNTNKGSIWIQLNPIKTPATVSAIDSLTRVGAYDNIPFHRVVPNFVVQGGDIEFKNGFGGPDYVLPTEPSPREFVRGTVGIASAGPDTEGSQFFIMHQWAPHLNGRYTIIGEVFKGMDVVDQLEVGDYILSAELKKS